jgi:hypothetical protein
MKMHKTETSSGRVYWIDAHTALHANHRTREVWRLNPRQPFFGVGRAGSLVYVTRREAARILREHRKLERGQE